MMLLGILIIFINRNAAIPTFSEKPTQSIEEGVIIPDVSEGAPTGVEASQVTLGAAKKTLRKRSYLRGKAAPKMATNGNDPKTNEFTIRIISDLDQRSKQGDNNIFLSSFREGTLRADPITAKYTVEWGKEDELLSKHNEAGRGMELSELVMYYGRLYTVEDRTGIVYEILDFNNKDKKPSVVPRLITTEGDGNTDKGMKLEWATVKDGELLLGSFGKEYTKEDGTVINRNNLWVMWVDEHGSIRHEDWSQIYEKIRHAAGADSGYLIHEAISWSEVMKKWVVLPRRVSQEAYNEVADEKKGSNMVILANEDFSDLEVLHVGQITPERGFSTFKFVPGTHDQIILAVKSEENAEKESQSSFLTVFNLKGEILMEETEIPGGMKYEGVEFIL